MSCYFLTNIGPIYLVIRDPSQKFCLYFFSQKYSYFSEYIFPGKCLDPWRVTYQCNSKFSLHRMVKIHYSPSYLLPEHIGFCISGLLHSITLFFSRLKMRKNKGLINYSITYLERVFTGNLSEFGKLAC